MLHRRHIWHFIILLMFIPQIAMAKEVIKSAVSPEFIDGLHAKYLRYLADKADMELVLFPIPFARRVIALEKGEIDLMVGIKSNYEKNEDLVFLQPPYERLRGALFVRAGEGHILQNEFQLKEIIMGVSIEDKEIISSVKQKFKEIVPVTNLRQKIYLLKKGRIDSFSHFEDSALRMITAEGLEDEIIPAPYQSQKYRYYHFAVSRNSTLLLYYEKLEAIIKKGVVSGDFLDIRLQHYTEKTASKSD